MTPCSDNISEIIASRATVASGSRGTSRAPIEVSAIAALSRSSASRSCQDASRAAIAILRWSSSKLVERFRCRLLHGVHAGLSRVRAVADFNPGAPDLVEQGGDLIERRNLVLEVALDETPDRIIVKIGQILCHPPQLPDRG